MLECTCNAEDRLRFFLQDWDKHDALCQYTKALCLGPKGPDDPWWYAGISRTGLAGKQALTRRLACVHGHIKPVAVATRRLFCALHLRSPKYSHLAGKKWVASHLHNLSDEIIAVDLNPAHMRPETTSENNSRRKAHQDGIVACDHDSEDRCKFGLVYYLDEPRPASQTFMPFGKYVWLLQHIFRLQQEEGITMSSKIFNQDTINLSVDEHAHSAQTSSQAHAQSSQAAHHPPTSICETLRSPDISYTNAANHQPASVNEGPTARIVCRGCYLAFPDEESFEEHQKLGCFRCDKCGFIARSKIGLGVHRAKCKLR